jgi:AraC-like DNA-binding protein
VALDGEFRVRPGAESAWQRHAGVVIPANQLHQLDGSGCELVIVYLEAESEDGRRIVSTEPSSPIQTLPPATVDGIRAATAAARADEAGPKAAGRLFQGILAELGLRLKRRDELDDRIRQALASIRADPARRWSAATLAGAARLSPRRFRELFGAQVGMSFRQYVLWTRVHSALVGLAGGASITEGAVAAGFADAAHLTRTFRRMVGIVPSAIAGSVTFVEEPP